MHKFLISSAAAVGLVCGFVGVSQGVDPAAKPRDPTNPVAAPAVAPSVAPKQVPSFAVRASNVIGMEVKNAAGHSLGTVNDLVLDDKGSVRYAAVSHGGVLGVGAKLFAVPYKSLAFKTSIDSDTRYVELNVDKKLLEKAPGFPSDKWPNFSDASFTKEVDSFYLNTGEGSVRIERE